MAPSSTAAASTSAAGTATRGAGCLQWPRLFRPNEDNRSQGRPLSKNTVYKLLDKASVVAAHQSAKQAADVKKLLERKVEKHSEETELRLVVVSKYDAERGGWHLG